MSMPPLKRRCAFLASGAVLCLALAVAAQQPSTPETPGQQPPAQAAPAQPAPAARTEHASITPPISEDEMRHQLEGKTFYLRGGWLDDSLHFNQLGQLDGSSPKASFTLALVQITRVHLDKRHLELEGVRYGDHFLGAAPFEDQAVDRVRLSPKKKPLRITIDREEVVAAKKQPPLPKNKKHPAPPPAQSASQTAAAAAQPQPAPAQENRHDAVVTTSQAQANKALRDAIDAVFASGIDQRMIATLPPYWQLYYKDVDLKQDYRPSDPSILRQNQVDKKARLVSVFDPPSNEYAQKNGVAGISMYHVVVEPDGKPGEIAIGRPIGFGLDESAVNAIRQATFDPAIKDGKPVPAVLDLVVEFRIYSKLTNRAAAKSAGKQQPVLPGPYSVNQPNPPADQRQPQ